MINVKPIALEQVRWAIKACEEKRGIEFIVASRNACCERGETPLTYSLPVGAYKRYAHLLADLLEAERQILNMLQGRDALTGHPLLNEEDDRQWSGESIERDHAEALEMDAERDTEGLAALIPVMTATEQAHYTQATFWAANDYASRRSMVELAHAEALAFNAEYDLATEMAAIHLHQLIFARQRPWVKALVVEMAHDEALTENATKGAHIEDPARMAAYGSWLARQRAAGRQLIDHACPRCDVVYLTNVPPVGDSYDSFCTCPACGENFLRIVDNLNGSPVVCVHSTTAYRSAAQ